MAYIILLYITVYLSGRLFFYDIETILEAEPTLNLKRNWRLVWSSLFIFFAPGLLSFLSLAGLHVLHVLFDSYFKSINRSRAPYAYLLHLIIVFLIIPGILYFILPHRVMITNPIQDAIAAFTVFCAACPGAPRALLILSGFLFTLKEGTIIIRLILNRIKAVPADNPKEQTQDEAEYERGRLIGILERTFVYFLILFDQIGGIAVIIALKSLARFNKLNDKTFAEYFLIGSLLSLLVASAPAVIVLLLLTIL